MSRMLILGATGSLGRQVTEQAVSANHQVSVLVRTPSKLPAELRAKVVVHQADLASTPVPVLATILRNQDAVINTAGMVTEAAWLGAGEHFVGLRGK